jgi:hypothetical protein
MARILALFLIVLIVGTGGWFLGRRWAAAPAPWATIRGIFTGEAVPATPAPSPTAPTDSEIGKALAQAYCKNAFAVVCANPTRATSDPTGKVDLEIRSEVRALRVLRRIIGAHPEWSLNQVEEELAKNLYTETRVKRIQSAFTWVREQLVAIIERQPESVFDDAEKAILRGRLNRLELNLPPPASVYADAADVLTKNVIYYERTPADVLRMRVGGAYLLNISSWFNLVFSMAHEFSHAIDPCEMEISGVVPRTYAKLVACFARSGWVPPDRAKCGENEQVSEVFADWMAGEVLSAALTNSDHEYTLQQKVQSAVNSVRDLCEEAVGIDVLTFQNHPTPEIRIGQLFGGNAKIRKVVGCAPTSHAAPSCEFETVTKISPPNPATSASPPNPPSPGKAGLHP